MSAIVGGSLFPTPLVAQVGAVILLFLAVAAYCLPSATGERAGILFWLAMIFFGLLIEGQITVARSGFGVQQALALRDATFSLFIVIGTYGILSTLLTRCDLRDVSTALWGGARGHDSDGDCSLDR